MGPFQKTVLFVSIILLIIILVIIGVALASSKDQDWPPVVPDCPDYWMMDGSGNNAVCINQKDLGVCPPRGNAKHQVMNFNAAPFTNSDGDCYKYKWAKKCKVSWDGITYGVNNPCQ